MTTHKELLFWFRQFAKIGGVASTTTQIVYHIVCDSSIEEYLETKKVLLTDPIAQFCRCGLTAAHLLIDYNRRITMCQFFVRHTKSPHNRLTYGGFDSRRGCQTKNPLDRLKNGLSSGFFSSFLCSPLLSFAPLYALILCQKVCQNLPPMPPCIGRLFLLPENRHNIVPIDISWGLT